MVSMAAVVWGRLGQALAVGRTVESVKFDFGLPHRCVLPSPPIPSDAARECVIVPRGLSLTPAQDG